MHCRHCRTPGVGSAAPPVWAVGSVFTVADVNAAADAGAEHLVSPVFVPAVAEHAAARGIPFVPGALTSNEIVRAHESGAPLVKVSPIGPAGGAAYLKQVRAPMPSIPLMPTGGIDLTEIGAYLKVGAVALGIGGPLLGDAITGGDLSALASRAERAMSEVGRQSPQAWSRSASRWCC